MTAGNRMALWGGTAVVSAAFVVVGVPQVRTVASDIAVQTVRLLRATGFDASIWLIALGVTAMTAGLLLRWARRVEDPVHRVRKYAARGASVATIARATGMAQDAVRDCLRAAPLAAQAAPSAGPRRTGGTLFRRPPARSAPPGPDFGAMLRRSASRATT